MRDVTKINPKYVGPNGKYFNYNTTTMFQLTPEEIYYLRKLWGDDMNNPKIAENVRVIVRTQSTTQVKPKKYKLTRTQKYNDGFYQLKEQLKRELATFVVIGGIVVSLVGGLSLYFDVDSKEYKNDNYYSSTMEEPIFVIEEIKPNLSETIKDENIMLNNEFVQREELIRSICDIYQVNYDVVYPVIEKITENFSSVGYLEGKIDTVTCKGFEVDARSDEELFIYMVRIIKQDPSRWNVSTDNLYIDNGYDSGDDYCKQIEHISNILGVDKYFMYAVVQSECGFNSNLFINSNNPAGIKNDSGNWWSFDTKEEGFLELGMELLKYYHWIDKPTDSLDIETLSEIRDIHAPLSDGNYDWLGNVLDRMEYARNNSEELFGSALQSNGLSQ